MSDGHKVSGFGHTAIVVTDMDRSIEFYTNVLGFSIKIRKLVSIEELGNMEIALMTLDGGGVELMSVEKRKIGSSKNESEFDKYHPGAIVHLSVVVDDIEACVENAAKYGAPISVEDINLEPEWIDGHSLKWIHFPGPDGEYLEFEQEF